MEIVNVAFELSETEKEILETLETAAWQATRIDPRFFCLRQRRACSENDHRTRRRNVVGDNRKTRC